MALNGHGLDDGRAESSDKSTSPSAAAANDHQRLASPQPSAGNKSSTFETNNNSLAKLIPQVGDGSGRRQADTLQKINQEAAKKRAADETPAETSDRVDEREDRRKQQRQSHTAIELAESRDDADRTESATQREDEDEQEAAKQQQSREDKTTAEIFANKEQEPQEDLALINKQEAGPSVKLISGQIHHHHKTANGAAALGSKSSPAANQQRDSDPDEPCAKHATKARRLSFLQGLLLRKWPYLALAICMMSSLIFGMLLSALSVYTMHFWSDCNGLALAAMANHNSGELARPILRPELGEFGPHEDKSHLAALMAPLDSAPLDSASSRPTSNGSAAAATQPGEPNKPHFQRLPHTLVPEHYDLFLWPIIAEPSFGFSGWVSIKFRCREATDNITLHALDLEVNEKTARLEQVPGANVSAAELKAAAGGAPGVKRVSLDRQMQYAIIHLDSQLKPGQDYALTLDFNGTLNDDLAGFYKIHYEQQNSTKPTWIAATQFEATDARRAFPCFDEPLFKATFSIQIKHWRNMTALSNMPIVSSEQSKDGLWITDSFAKSQRMSTYLVAFTVTNFESRSEGNISVWTRPGFAHTAEYALRIAGKILRHYEDFFGIEYPLPKVDMIALPDFNAGAMENWGLITYRETAMLFDETTSSITNKQRVATVVAHELGHQWFGNLVTPKWWDDLWLNEGFATFVEYIGVDFVEPMWQMREQFVDEELHQVFRLDGLTSSHQISIPVNNPDEISEIFDQISYSKGASVIRMMSNFLTEDVFKHGLRRYLRALKYDNAEQSDLWAHLTEAQRQLGNSSASSGQVVNVERVMNSWTLQTGYPLVILSRGYGEGARGANLEQVRFQPFKSIQNTNNGGLSNSTSGLQKLDARQQKWEIPITYTWQSEQDWTPKTRLWLHQNSSGPVELEAAEAKRIGDDEWLLLNLGQVGYYRVNYDTRNWRLLLEQLLRDHTKIPPINRAQLLDDMFELAKSSVIDYKLPFEAAKYLKGEQNYLPWDTVLNSFSYIDDMLQRTPIYGQWKDYLAELIQPYYARYKDLEWTVAPPATGGVLKQQLLSARSENGTVSAAKPVAAVLSAMDSNDVLEQYNQINAIGWACQVDEHCIAKAKRYFKQWKETRQNLINPALRSSLYCTAIENGNRDDWDFLWRIYEKEQNASERERILRALGCSKEMWMLSRYLEWSFDKTKPIRRQDGSYVFRKVAGSNHGRDLAFNFMREHWTLIKEFYGKSSFSLGHLIRSVCTSMNTQTELDELRLFYENVKNDIGTGKRSFQIAIEEVESNVLWRKHNYKIIESWLNQQRVSSPSAVVVS